jgi:catechol 2,3-dioxygenase
VSAAPDHLMDTVVGAVELRAGDAGLLRDFYESALGLTASGDGERIDLADAEGRILLRLDGESAVGAPPLRRPAAGLFHVAYRYPTRAALAAALDRAMKAAPEFQGASDHGVSEAIYLGDPEGNGIELYWDRPFEQWPMEGDSPGMFTKPLDLSSLLAELPAEPGPAVADVGHIHLKASDLSASTRFYLDLVGLDFRQTYPSAAFMAEGMYHHHVAANTWQSAGAAPSAADEPGLAGFELRLRSQDSVDAVAERAEQAGRQHRRSDGAVTIDDPDGSAITLLARS